MCLTPCVRADLNVAEASADNVVNNGLVVEGDELRLTAPDAVVTAYDRVQ